MRNRTNQPTQKNKCSTTIATFHKIKKNKWHGQKVVSGNNFE
jgi:hypothetical protein